MKLSTVLVGSLLLVGSATPAFANSSLIGRWNLNNNNNSVATDTSGNNLDGVSSNITVVSGKFGNGYDFTNSGSVRVSDNAILDSQNVSVEAWVKAINPGTFSYIISKGANGNTNASYGIYTGSTGGLAFYISDANTFYLSPDAGTSVWDGNWHQVTGTYDGNTIRLYVDSVQVGNGTPAAITIDYNLANGNDLYLGTYGSQSSSSTYNFKGQIDEVRVWNIALSADTIAQHTQSNSSAVFPYSGQ